MGNFIKPAIIISTLVSSSLPARVVKKKIIKAEGKNDLIQSVSKLSEAMLEKWEKSKEKLSSKVEQAIRKSKKSNDNIELIMKSLLEMV